MEQIKYSDLPSYKEKGITPPALYDGKGVALPNGSTCTVFRIEGTSELHVFLKAKHTDINKESVLSFRLSTLGAMGLAQLLNEKF